MLRDTQSKFGAISILLHWAIGLSVIVLLGIGIYMVDLGYYDPLYTTLPHWHKSLGVLVGGAVVARLLWVLKRSKPDVVAGTGVVQAQIARLVHWSMTLLLVLIVLSGYLISTANGQAIDVFGWFELPAVVSELAQQADRAGEVHRYLSYALIALIIGHAGAALKHHFLNRDETLSRMLGLSRRSSESSNQD